MKKKICVIGGGLGAMSAIYQLMKMPGSKDLFDITLYQEGWRIGGKGASGVNLDKGYRVEEHGIHFWFGFYENGFRLMKEVYEAMDRPKGNPLATFTDAFKPQPFMDFAQRIGDQWSDWEIPFPDYPGVLGDGKFENPIEVVLEVGIKVIADEFHKILQHLEDGCLGLILKPFRKTHKIPVHPSHEEYLNKVETEVLGHIENPIERRLRAMILLHKDKDFLTNGHLEQHFAYVHSLRLHIWNILGHLLMKSPNILKIWCLIDFGLTVLKGIIEDHVLTYNEEGFHLDFGLINDFDFKEWLIYHGADKHFIYNVPVVKSMYDGPFAFFKGAISTPNVEAGTALNIFFRLAFTSKEHVMWRMQAGMGDTVFAPIFQLLKRDFPENVHFKFFHKAESIRLNKDETQAEEIDLIEQVKLAEGIEEYNPLYNVNGLDCWPSAPLYDQIDPLQAKLLKKEHINLESNWSDWSKGKKVKLIQGKDFDEVIIGASLASLPNFCSHLINKNPKIAIMLDRVGTVQTQAFQLWLTKNPEELGVKEQKVLSTYVEPLDTFAEMNQILKREDWSAFKQKPLYLMYVCGALLDSETIPPYHATYFPDNQQYKVKGNMKNYILNNLKFVLPGAFDKDGNFDWDILFDPTGGVGEARLDYQYYRSNINTSERYVFSLKGSSKFRLKTDETGFSNVFFTGDWIQNGLNIGFVEGATISGILTARAVSGNKNIPIYVPW